jgi:hypothetical protein
MNLNLTAALANVLPARAETHDQLLRWEPTSDGLLGGITRTAPVPLSKPVLQLNAFPVTLNPAVLANPYSRQNPDGDMRAAYAFRKIVDPVPSLSRTYHPSGHSIEEIYGNLVNYASIPGNQRFVAGAFSSANKKFREAALSALSIMPGEWRLVGAMPSDWYDVTQVERFQDVELDLTGSEDASGPFTVVPGSETAQWRLGDPARPEATETPHKDTQILSLKLKYLQVTFERPWLDFELFDLSGWSLQGQPSGYYSTGRIDDNRGVLPLLPTSLILGIDIAADVHLGDEDRDLVAHAVSAKKALSLGPFQFMAVAASGASNEVRCKTGTADSAGAVLHVVGMISTLVPLAPKDSSMESDFRKRRGRETRRHNYHGRP